MAEHESQNVSNPPRVLESSQHIQSQLRPFQKQLPHFDTRKVRRNAAALVALMGTNPFGTRAQPRARGGNVEGNVELGMHGFWI